MMIREFNILYKHGRQYIPEPEKSVLPETFRGRPEIDAGITVEEARLLTDLCPLQALSPADGLTLDIGKCTFCGECAAVLPGRLRFTNDFRLAVNRRQQLLIRAGDNRPLRPDHNAIRPEIRKLFRRSLKLRQVSAGGDNSGEMELNAAGNVNFDMGRYGIEFVASPRHADGLVVTGPVPANMARALEGTWEAIPGPKILVLCGTDAISGGLFRESPAIDRSFFDSHTPDLYVPGNPAHPLSFILGLLDLVRHYQ